MHHRSPLFAFEISLAFVLPVAAVAQPTSPIPTISTPWLDDTWNCLMSPSGFFSPGTIFEFGTEQGRPTVRRIADLSSKLKIDRRSTGLPAYEEDRTLSSSLVLGLINRAKRLAQFDVGAGVEVQGSRRVRYEGVTHELPASGSEDVIRRWVRANPSRFAGLVDGKRYRWVSEAYLAERVTYNVTESMVSSLGLSADLPGFATLKATPVQYNNRRQFAMDQVFKPPLRICVRVVPIGVTSAEAGGKGELDVMALPVKLPTDVVVVDLTE